MNAQDVLIWFEIPERGLARAQRLYEALHDIAARGERRRSPVPAGCRRPDAGTGLARACTGAPPRGPEA
jgi:hypothetical protein